MNCTVLIIFIRIILLSPVIDIAWKRNILSHLNRKLSSSHF